GGLKLFKGALDEASLYDRSLEADEVYASYRTGERGKAGVAGRPEISAGKDQRTELFKATLEGDVFGGDGDVDNIWSHELSCGSCATVVEGQDCFQSMVSFEAPGT